MTRSLVVEPEAEAEIAAAATWYEARASGWGPRFLRAVESSLRVIERNPHEYQPIFRDVRRTRVPRFPYGLLYVTTDEE